MAKFIFAVEINQNYQLKLGCSKAVKLSTETWFHPIYETHFVFFSFIMELESLQCFSCDSCSKKKKTGFQLDIHIFPIKVYFQETFSFTEINNGHSLNSLLLSYYAFLLFVFKYFGQPPVTITPSYVKITSYF